MQLRSVYNNADRYTDCDIRHVEAKLELLYDNIVTPNFRTDTYADNKQS